MCQKVINVLAVASFAVSGAIAASGLYVYVNRTSIIDGVKRQVIESVTGSLGGSLGGGALVPEVGAGIPSGSSETSMGGGLPSI
tara:strand:+ start:416 stop:667 length:252 start_codon:yes stop_codon:yes gene_type:complete